MGDVGMKRAAVAVLLTVVAQCSAIAALCLGAALVAFVLMVAVLAGLAVVAFVDLEPKHAGRP